MLLFILCSPALGQGITALRFPGTMCEGSSMLVTVGYEDSNNVQLRRPRNATLGRGETTFLPDGVPCGSMGCSYQSAVNFDAFYDGAVLSSVEDLNYLRIKIEHSYLGDLYINLTCPNNSRADLLRYGGPSNSSSCTNNIPGSSVGWLAGDNMAEGTFLGLAQDGEDTQYPCNASSPGNSPGVGWNYCWSNNTTMGYNYASGDGIIYRSGHEHFGIVDSSNVVNHTNFYHPDDNFSNLLGCPLNGEWFIEVQDGWASDNGYIFEWELSFNDNLLPPICNLDHYTVLGQGITSNEDGTFLLTVPQGLTHDTTIQYWVFVYYDCDTIVDTSFSIYVRHSSDVVIHEEVIENNLPYLYAGQAFSHDVTDSVFHFVDSYGCDSTLHFNLTVWRNMTQQFDTMICFQSLPFIWHNHSFGQADSLAVQYTDMHGADSIEILVVGLLPNVEKDVYATICEGSQYVWIDGFSYSDPNQIPTFVVSHPGVCDSIFKLHLQLIANNIKAQMSVSPNPAQPGDLVTLTDLSGATNTRWQLLDNVWTHSPLQFAYPSDVDSVQVVLIVSNTYGCVDTAVVSIYSDRSAVWLPNAFTPEEQQNNIFRVACNDLLSGTVYIFDRRGIYVAEFDALTGYWDGRKGGSLCPEGVYVWLLRYVTLRQPKIEQLKKGTVILLR